MSDIEKELLQVHRELAECKLTAFHATRRAEMHAQSIKQLHEERMAVCNHLSQIGYLLLPGGQIEKRSCSNNLAG